MVRPPASPFSSEASFPSHHSLRPPGQGTDRISPHEAETAQGEHIHALWRTLILNSLNHSCSYPDTYTPQTPVKWTDSQGSCSFSNSWNDGGHILVDAKNELSEYSKRSRKSTYWKMLGIGRI